MNISEAAVQGGMLGHDGVALFKSYGLPYTAQPWQVISLVGMTFLLGLASVWLYAAIRFRYGAGPRTAIRAGLAVWLLAHPWSGAYIGAGFTGLIPAKLAWLPVAWGFVEAPLATLAGAAIYKEN